MRIHAWKGDRYYPNGPVRDYVGCFDTEELARLAIGDINREDDWATLMQESENGGLVPLRTWQAWQGFPSGWRDWDPLYD